MLAWWRTVQSVTPTDVSVEWERFQAGIKKCGSLKATGPDGICAYWWKVLRQAAAVLHGTLSEIVGRDAPDFPAWFVKGRTVLIPKQGCEGKANQYRPITCLNNGVQTAHCRASQHPPRSRSGK